MKSLTIDMLKNDSPDQISEKLKAALRSDGDFPAGARVVAELRTLANNPNTSIDQISDVILREPSLGTRVLHLVNSAFYQRTQPIVTVSQAVTQLGMRPLSDLCSGLVLMSRFIPAAKRGGIFADNLRKGILTALLTSAIAKESGEERIAEEGYLAGTFYNLGSLLLAYYFPQVYEAAARRAEARHHDIVQSLTEILGVSPVQLSLTIVDALEIPEYYCTLMQETDRCEKQGRFDGPHAALALSLFAADRIASTIVNKTSDLDLTLALTELTDSYGFTRNQLNKVMRSLPEVFREHCKLIEMGFLTLPEYLESFSLLEGKTKKDVAPASADGSSAFAHHIEEIKQAIADQEPISSIITSVMETMAFGLSFHRVFLLLASDDRTELLGKMALGQTANVDVKALRRRVDKKTVDDNPDIASFLQGCPVIFGDPIFEDGWPFAAVPIGGNTKQPLGVIYADMVPAEDGENPPLEPQIQASLSVLAELLDQAAAQNK